MIEAIQLRNEPRRIRTNSQTTHRSGSVTLELIIMLPVWLIAVGAIIQFGLLIGNRQQVALAARVGAEEASRTPGLDLTSGGGLIPENVVAVVRKQLSNSGIQECKITLEHNLAVGEPVVLSYELDSQWPATPDPQLSMDEDYVRVTVYVRSTELAPNMLGSFSFDASRWIISNSTTFRHERPSIE
ncbi:MAG: pilus assembly protein [Thermoguttaceae bacterium]|jgi:Flp pilus assembly protein TadG|nr:pilus assembly protein [Thermoguttaceae bacterium]